MITEPDQPFLRRALRLAMNGRGHVEPNPMVGCVLVKDGQIIGEGWHAKYGEAHAEPNALNDCKQRGNDPASATAYVTLEPCCHTNKKTPPCAPRLIEAKIARVVIGCLDPNPDVNGKGGAMLRDAGIGVDTLPDPSVALNASTAPNARNAQGWPSLGVEPLDASHFQQLIAPFTRRQSGWTTITLKWAETIDSKVSGANGSRLQITGSRANRLVHELRTRCDAIVIGINTALVDNPLLTPRDVSIIRRPLRCVLDSQLRLPLTSRLAQTARETPVVIFTGPITPGSDRARAADSLRALGVQISHNIDRDHAGLDRFEVFQMGRLTYEPITHVMVEPGPTLARSLMRSVAHRLWVFRSKRVAGGPTALDAPAIPTGFSETGRIDLGDDVLTEYLAIRGSPNPHIPSADFVLAAESVHSPVA